MRRLFGWLARWFARLAQPKERGELGGCQYPGCGRRATVEVGEVFSDGLGDREVSTGMLAAFCKHHDPCRESKKRSHRRSRL